MAKLAIIGTGRVAKNLAAKFVETEHDLVVGARNPVQARETWPHSTVVLTEVADAIIGSSIVINATPGDATLDLFSTQKEALAGKILIDLSNATLRGENGLPSGLLYAEGSLASRLQDALPETAVVKTLNTMLFTVMTNPEGLSVPPTVYLSGNDPSAKATVKGLLYDLGWQDDWIEDLGGIESAQGAEALVLLVPHILKARGFAPFAVSIAR